MILVDIWIFELMLRLLIFNSLQDMNRRIVKSDHATITVPEIDFEIPPITQQGTLNTLEGFFMQVRYPIKVSETLRSDRWPIFFRALTVCNKNNPLERY